VTKNARNPATDSTASAARSARPFAITGQVNRKRGWVAVGNPPAVCDFSASTLEQAGDRAVLEDFRIARASNGAIDRTVSLSNCFSSVMGRLLLTITSLTRQFLRLSVAAPEKMPCVAAMITSVAPLANSRSGGLHDRAAGVDHVVDQQARLPGDIADDAVRDDLVGDVRVARLVHEGDRASTQLVGPLFGHADAAGVGRDDREVSPSRTCS